MPQKILIVEDEANIAQLLHLYLEKEGYETQIAPDGGKAVELFRAFAPDLVLLDIMLPVMDGSPPRGGPPTGSPAWSRGRTTTSSSPLRPRRYWPGSGRCSAGRWGRRRPAGRRG